MARKIANYTVTEDGRDKGKKFLITEMSTVQGEEWAMRALLALAQSNVQVPDDFFDLGMAGVASMGVKALFNIKWELAKPLMDELMLCVQWQSPTKSEVFRPLIDEDIEEIVTRTTLKWEVLKLHVDFSHAAALSESVTKAVRRKSVTRTSQD